MSDKKMEKAKYTEVWGDTVILQELVYACIIGVILTMGMFFVGQSIFGKMESLEPSLANGYSLLVGVSGCLISGVVSAKLFKPKRIVEEKFEFENIEEILESAGMTVDEEAAALAVVDESIIKELEELELYALLALIPKGSKNYKPEYKKKMSGGI